MKRHTKKSVELVRLKAEKLSLLREILSAFMAEHEIEGQFLRKSDEGMNDEFGSGHLHGIGTAIAMVSKIYEREKKIR